MPSKEEITEAFTKADTEKSGKVTVKQFQEILIELANDDDERKRYQNKGFVDAILFSHDGNEDGVLSLEELLNFNENKEEKTAKMFKRVVENSDKDKDGFLTAEELKGCLLMMNPGLDEGLDEVIDMMIRMCAGANGAKKVKAEEVVKYFLGRGRAGENQDNDNDYSGYDDVNDDDDDEQDEDPKEKVKVMFRMFDTNSDGYLDKKELVQYMTLMADWDEEDEKDFPLEKLLKVMIAEFDEDEDGKLNYEEFEKFADNY